eukprot:GILK01003664.1.p1 GENE.GILK01003664.1~~GILK01003664.1.p1  ORF type:complete len:520 (+),score=107.69 GILK01003664.1:47-1606(+)
MDVLSLNAPHAYTWSDYAVYASGFLTAIFLLFVALHAILIRYSVGKNEPPLLAGWIPYFGVGPYYGMHPVKFLQEAKKKHGSVFTIYAGGKVMTVVLDPDFHKDFFRSPDSRLMFWEPQHSVRLPEVLGAKFSAPAAAPLMQIIAKKLIPRYNRMPPIFEPEISYFFKTLMGDKGSVNLYAFMDHIVLGLSIQALCPAFSRNEEFYRLLERMEELSQAILKRPGALGNGILVECRAIRAKLDVYIREEMDKRIAEGPSRVPEREDLLDMVMEVYAGQDDMIMGSIVGTLFAAIANTTATAVYTIIHLLKDANLLKDVTEEVVTVLKAHGGRLTLESMKDLVFTEAVVMETLRMYATPLSIRETNEEITVGEYTIPKNRVVAISANVYMNDSEYFEEPDRYNPYRFMKSSPTGESESAKWIGFGGGRHMCKGMNLAKIELKMIIASLVNQYELTGFDGVLAPPEWVSLGVAFPQQRQTKFTYVRRDVPLVTPTVEVPLKDIINEVLSKDVVLNHEVISAA